MPKYKYQAVDLSNKKIKGTYIAIDDEDLKRILRSQNLYLLKYKKIPESSQMFGFLEKINLDDFTLFCRQFAIMISAGLNIDKIISILRESTKNSKLKSILEVVYNDLLKGKNLSESFGRYPKTFPVFFRNMIAIGELSGRLDIVFNRLADYYENDARTKKKVKSALSYPIFLILIAVGALAVISLVVMPQFTSVFSEFGADLPLISQIVIDVTTFFRENFTTILLVLMGLVAFFLLIKRIPTVRRRFDYFKLQLPIIKNLNIATITSRFSNGFSVLLANGMQLLDAIDIISKLLDNKIVEEKLQIVKNEISVGKSVSKSLETINLFPDMLIEMISVGEETASLEEVLDRITPYFDEQVSAEIKKMTSSIEPIMIIMIGLIVVVVLLAIFMPMLGLMGAIESTAE